MKIVKSRIIAVGALVALASVTAHAQTAAQSAPSDLLQQYANASAQWANVGFGYAKTLFGLLAAIEFAWLGAMLAMEGHELQGWIAQIIKKMMTVMFFYAVLINYKVWVPAIIQSFQQVGQEASGITVKLNPSDILLTGLRIAGNMLAAAMPSTKTTAVAAVAALIPGVGAALTASTLVPTLIVLLGALAVFSAYLIIMIAFIMATIESYIVLGAGVIFLGFGASRWTVPYVERYLSLAVATGVRLMVMYMIIGLGQQLGAQWTLDAQNLTLSIAGCESIFGIVAGAVTFMAVAWSVPKMISGMLSGSLSLGSSDLIAPVTAGVVGAATLGAMVATGGAAAVAGLAGTAAATGGAGGVLSAGSAAEAGASGLGAASMSTETATPLAVDPIVGSQTSTDMNGSTIANPIPPSGDSSGGAGGPFDSGSTPPTESSSPVTAVPGVANAGGSPAASESSPATSTTPTESSTPVTAAPGVVNAGGSSTASESSPAIVTSSTGSGTAGAVEANQGSSSADGGTLTSATPVTPQTSKPSETQGTASVPETNKEANKSTLADNLTAAGDTVSKLASHAPQDSHSASAPSINLSHGD